MEVGGWFIALSIKLPVFMDRMLFRSPVKPGMTGQIGDDGSTRTRLHLHHASQRRHAYPHRAGKCCPQDEEAGVEGGACGKDIVYEEYVSGRTGLKNCLHFIMSDCEGSLDICSLCFQT